MCATVNTADEKRKQRCHIQRHGRKKRFQEKQSLHPPVEFPSRETHNMSKEAVLGREHEFSGIDVLLAC